MASSAGEEVGRLVQVDAAVGGAAVVLDLEGEGGVAGAVGVGRGAELELVGTDVSGAHHLFGGHGPRALGPRLFPYTTLFRSRGEEVGRGVVGVGEAEVGGGEGVVGV